MVYVHSHSHSQVQPGFIPFPVPSVILIPSCCQSHTSMSSHLLLFSIDIVKQITSKLTSLQTSVVNDIPVIETDIGCPYFWGWDVNRRITKFVFAPSQSLIVPGLQSTSCYISRWLISISMILRTISLFKIRLRSACLTTVRRIGLYNN